MTPVQFASQSQLTGLPNKELEPIAYSLRYAVASGNDLCLGIVNLEKNLGL
jgi:hypothetical protein